MIKIELGVFHDQSDAGESDDPLSKGPTPTPPCHLLPLSGRVRNSYNSYMDLTRKIAQTKVEASRGASRVKFNPVEFYPNMTDCKLPFFAKNDTYHLEKEDW